MPKSNTKDADLARITPEMVDKADHEATWKDGRESWLRTMAEALSRLLRGNTNA